MYNEGTIAMKNAGQDWYQLDNAAKIFPGQNSRTWSNVFRVGVELQKKVDPLLLKTALNQVLDRFPTFDVRLKHGLFWHYFEKNPHGADVQPDVKNICYRINFKENRGFLFRVYYHDKRIAVDFFHALGDGYANTVFVSTLVAQYLRLCGAEIGCGGAVLDLNDEPTAEEQSDAYRQYADSKAKYDRRDKNMYHAQGIKEGSHLCNYTIGVMSASQLNEAAKRCGATLTEFLAAQLLDIHYQKQLREEKKQKELCIQIPVDLRRHFPSKTLRNFVVCIRVKLNPAMGDYTFEEILRQVQLQMKLQNEPKFLNSMMTQNMKVERNVALRATPLWLKDLVVGISFAITAEQTTTALLSNIGKVELPPEMYPYIEKYMFFTGPGQRNGGRCGVISCGDTLCLTVSNCYRETEIERELFTRLVKLGVHVKIESNRV